MPSVSINEALLAETAMPEGEAAIRAVDMQADIRYLADDAREGRGLGTKGLEISAEYIARRFEAAGLSPAGDDGTYFQNFKVTTGATLGQARAQKLAVGRQAARFDKAWRPFGFSAGGEITAEVVFVGYGISAPELGYDDYEGLDVKGKIVLALRHEPGRRDKSSVFNGDQPSRYSELRYKAYIARQRGAAGLIIVNDPASYAKATRQDPDALYAFRGESGEAGLLAVHMTYKGGVKMARALGLDLKALQKGIDEGGKPASQATGKEANLVIDIERESATVRNVVAVLQPEGDVEAAVRRRGALVVGAHYDHLGMGGSSSRRHGAEEVHNGADDNASGTSMIMELAQALAPHKAKLQRPVYFVAFTAEEIGLRGSEHFVNNPPVATEKMAAMINFDMIGRLKEDKLVVGGLSTAAEFPALVAAASEDVGLRVNPRQDGFGPSDHASFYGRRVPVLYFFTGVHDEYHTPEDDIDDINLEGMEQIGALAWRIVSYLALEPQRPLYTQADVRAKGDRGGSGSRSYGKAYLGTVPAFDDTGGKGVRLQGVRPGSPAAKAGLQPGDVLMGINDVGIKDLQEFTYALRALKPGDKVTLIVERQGERMELKATIGARQ